MSIAGVVIRDERRDDAREIADVITAAFDGAPHAGGNEAAIVKALRTAGALSISLVATRSDALVGHVAFSPVSIEGASGWLGLGPVSVAAQHQRDGIGAALIERGLAIARAAGANGVVVLGDPAYYARFGFRAIEGLQYGDVPPGPFQALPFADHTPSGDVRYHAAFDTM